MGCLERPGFGCGFTRLWTCKYVKGCLCNSSLFSGRIGIREAYLRVCTTIRGCLEVWTLDPDVAFARGCEDVIGGASSKRAASQPIRLHASK